MMAGGTASRFAQVVVACASLALIGCSSSAPESLSPSHQNAGQKGSGARSETDSGGATAAATDGSVGEGSKQTGEPEPAADSSPMLIELSLASSASPQPPPPDTAVGPSKSSKDRAINKKPADDALKLKDPAPPRTAHASTPLGGVDPEEVAAVLTREMSRFRPCVTSDATVRIEATLGNDGSVLEAKSERSTPDNPKLRECVVAAFSKLRFKRPPQATTAGASLRLDLKLNGGG